MVQLTATPAMLEALAVLRHSGKSITSHEGDPPLDELKIGRPISHEQVISLWKASRELKENGSSGCSLDKLLRGSEVYIEPAKPKPRPSAEYQALMARLRQEEEARAYNRMLNSVQPKDALSPPLASSKQPELFTSSQADIGGEDEVMFADVNRQLALIANVLVSVVACSIALWIVARHWSTPSRLSLSMGGSGLVGVAEVVIYAGYLQRIKDAKERERRKVETKTIVDTWVIGGEENVSGTEEETKLVGDEKAGQKNVKRRVFVRERVEG